MILHRLDSHGGFTCGDAITRRTAYAYPRSTHATLARRDPLGVARRMLAHESPRRDPDTRARDEKRLAELLTHCKPLKAALPEI